jgi:hydrogenase/urease accessory protein HupE
MTLIKMGVVIVFTVTLSVLAEVTSPGVAGILSGYPMGAAVALFFIGLEIGPGFAAESSLHTSAGIVATLVFTYCYYRGSVLSGKPGGVLQILFACMVGVAGQSDTSGKAGGLVNRGPLKAVANQWPP